MTQVKIGVLLLNLGTPHSYAKKDVFRYLREFLSDPRVIDIPKFFRWLLLYCIILPFRTSKSAKAYQKIWEKEGSPLLFHSQQLAKKVQEALGPQYLVHLAMRYQTPSIPQALTNLLTSPLEKLIVLPLFPQYSSAATGSALEKTYSQLATSWNIPPVQTIAPFYTQEFFIECFANRIKQTLTNFPADYILFSYHGLPERHILKSQCSTATTCLKQQDCCETINSNNLYCYKAQCIATTKALVEKIQCKNYESSFQSRLGRTKWIEPYTDIILEKLATQGYQNIAVVCPAFVADCLETLEEIAMRAKHQWRELGGQDLILVPSLNSEPDWVQAVTRMIQQA